MRYIILILGIIGYGFCGDHISGQREIVAQVQVRIIIPAQSRSHKEGAPQDIMGNAEARGMDIGEGACQDPK